MKDKKNNGKKFPLLPSLFLGLSGFLLFFAVFVLLKETVLLETSQTSRSYLTFTPEIVQFDSVSQGTVTGKATLTNTSRESVMIDSVTKGCDCAQVLIEKGLLLPGVNREISFQWDTRGRRGKNEMSIGVVYFVGNDLVKHITPLMFTAMVIPDFDIIPNKLVFLSDQQKSLSFILRSVGQQDIRIEDAVINHPAFTVVVADDRITGTVSFDPKLWTDNIRHLAVQMTTSSENEPIFQVPINIVVNN